MLRLSGGSGRQTIFWSRFFREWSSIENLKFVKESIGWIIDLMMIFLSNVLVKTKLSNQLLSYTHDFTIDIDGSYQYPQPRALAKTTHPIFQAFLITFARSEIVALIWKEKETLEVFFPFPYLHDDIRYRDGIQKVLSALQKNWLRLRNPEIRTFTFSKDFVGSNIWVPYFASLRLKLTFDQIQKLFLNPQLKIELENKALFTYHNIGKNIGQCISKNTSNSNYANLFNPNATRDFAINAKEMFNVATLLNDCKLNSNDFDWFDNIEPLLIGEENVEWPTDIDPKWNAFIPTKDATEPIFHFV